MSPSIESLLAEFIERREAGEVLEPGAFAAEHPAVSAELLVALAGLDSAEGLFPQPDETPSRVGPWVLGPLIGRGGMGRVHRAHRADDPERAPFAIKLLDPRLAIDGRAAARIEREGAVLGDLDHEGLVRVHDVGTGPSGHWIAMDLVEGEPLSVALTRARRAGLAPPLRIGDGDDPWAAIAELGARVADAIAVAHDRGLVHRDVKPSNIIVGPGGAPVLIDFGLAAQDGEPTLTHTGDLLGTPQYMAPEQARGERADGRADLWGLGATLHELCTLRPPVSGSDALAALEQLRRGRPARLAGSSSVPSGLARVIDRTLSFRAERRPASAARVAEELRRCARGEAPRVRRAGAIERLEDAARSHPRRFAVGIGVFVVLLGVLLATRWIGGRDADRSDPRGDLLRQATLAYLARDEPGWMRAAEGLEELPDGGRFAGLLRALRDREAPLDDAGEEPLASLALGLRALRAGEDREAMAPLRRAAQRGGTWALPLVLLGEAARDAGELEVCEREWTAAARLVPDSPDLYRRLGKVRRSRGDVPGAVDAFRRARDLGPEDWRNHAELARGLAQLGDAALRPEALEAVTIALERCPRPSRALLNVQATLLGLEGRGEEARAIYRRILEREPDHFHSHFNLAYSHDLDCELSEARAAYERAAELRPASVEAHYALARIALGSDRGTCEACRTAVASDPSLVDAGRAEHHLVAALRCAEGSEDWLPGAAADLAIEAGRAGPVADAIEALLAERPDVDEWTVRLERALRRLRSR